jgi:DNA-binding transcriptional LysR family regulator
MGPETQLGVEPRHLAALVAVHEKGSFRGAAMALDCAQSAVSQRIAHLERLVGMRLVERARGHATLRLTEAGLTLVEHAEHILAELDAAMADLHALAGDPAPALRVGAYESVASRILPGALKRLAVEASEVTVSLHEDPDWPRFFPLVATGRLDAAFADLPLEPGPFASQELMRDTSVLLVRADSPLAQLDRPPTLAEIGALPLIAPSWPMMSLMTEHLRAAGVDPQFVFRSELNSGVQSLVAEGVGAALQPRLSVDEGDPRVVVIPLDGVLPARRIALYWHRERKHDGAIKQFLTALMSECDRGVSADALGAAGDRSAV